MERGIPPGERFLRNTPILRVHAGAQPDLFLRWNTIPAAAAAIDVVVHLHGFSQQGSAMPLSDKVPRSGLDLSGRVRPTLAVLPRGNWIRHSWYDFPAVLNGGLDRLVAYALGHFACGGGLRVDRLILTAHSGGGMPAIEAVAGASRRPDEVHIFDGLYGHDPRAGDPFRGIQVIEAWLADRIAGEPARPGALRVIYIERQTGPFSQAVAALVERHLAAADPELAPALARRYRVERSGVPHGYVASVCGPLLLADPATDIDWASMI